MGFSNSVQAEKIKYNDYTNGSFVLGEKIDQTEMEAVQRCVMGLTVLGHNHARNNYAFDKDAEYILQLFSVAQKQERECREGNDNLLRAAYTAIGEAKFNRKCNECKKRAAMQMREMIPIPYAVFGAITLAMTILFGTFLGMFMFSPISIMNPWLNVMWFLGSLGLFATDIAAIYERKVCAHGKTKKVKK
jgi:hypothetical protein